MNDVDPKLLVPHGLDDPPKFLFWDADVAFIAVVGLVFGFWTQQVLVFSVLGFYAAYKFQKLKSGRHRAFGLHSLYWHLPIRFGMKRTPASAVREFIG
jgi:conjugal transfer pilus assembly protein TraL